MNKANNNNGDQKLEEMLDVIFKFAAGDLTARGTLSGDDSSLDGVMAGINILGEELQARVTEAQQAQQSLADSEAQLRAIFNTTQDGIILAEAQTWRFRMTNDSICRMLGYSRDELLNLTIFDIHPEEELDNVGRHLERQLKGENIVATLPVQRKDGSVFYADINAAPVTLDGQQYIAGVFRDITDRRQAEEKILNLNQALEEKVQQLLATQDELEQHRAHLEQEVARQTASLTEAQRIAHLGNWEWDLVNNTVSWSDEMYRIFGLLPKQLDPSYEAFLNAVYPEDRQLVDDSVREALQRQHTYSIEHRILQPDGTLRYVHGQAEVIHGEDGQPTSMVGTFQDITKRKQVEDTLQESEERFHSISATAQDAIIMMDKDKNISYWNEAAEKIFGYSAEEVMGQDLHQLLVPARFHEAFFKEYGHFKNTGEGPAIGKTLELAALRKDGSEFPVELSLSAALLGNQWIAIAMVRDITKRKQKEDELHMTVDRLNEAEHVGKIGFLDWDLITNEIELSDEALRIYGLAPTRKKLELEEITKLVHPDDVEDAVKSLRNAIETGAKHDIEHRIIRTDGTVVYVHTPAQIVRDANGKPIRILGTVQDITERKQMETDLRESEQAYRTLSQNMPGMIYRVLIREGGRMQFYNEMPAQITGYTADELATGKLCSIESLILDEDRPGVEAEVMRAMAEKRAFVVEYRLKHKDGGIRWMEEHGMPVYGTDGAPLYIDGVIFDVTEHKQDEIKLQLFRALLDNSSDAVEVMDPVTLGFIDVNDTECRELGYSREELLSMKIMDIDVELTPNQMKEFMAHIQQKGEVRFESVHRRKDDTKFPVEVITKLVELDKPYLMSIARDITERKHAEAEVQILQEQLREQALHDPLTGLYNRRYLEESIGREIIRAERYSKPIGIVMCDIDHFKRVNDSYGHLEGDEVLKAFAELLSKHSRGSDIVCRFGGEEFLLLLPDMPPDIAYQRAEELRASLESQQIGKSLIQVTASFGVAAFPLNGTTIEALISAVDTAMYRAKETGRNRVVVASAHEKDVPDHTATGITEVS